MHNYKIAFVILHYQNAEVTRDSVAHLLALPDIAQHEIVVVDNASPNGTGAELAEEYAAGENVHVLLNDTNAGFAAGNNLGYGYARRELGAQVMVVMNSDVNITDPDFIRKLQAAVDSHPEAGVIAPDIVVKNGFHQNPYMSAPISTPAQQKIILKKRIGLLLYGLPVIGKVLMGRKAVRDFQPNKQEKVTQELAGLIPHGACVIYTPRWTAQEERAFVEGTFLFVEEELLYDYCLRKGHGTVYIPDLTVHHMEDASQDAVNDTAIKKKRNQMRFEIASRRLLVKLRKQNGEK